MQREARLVAQSRLSAAATAAVGLLALSMALASPVLAVDGVVEINAASAAAGGVTGGDTPGFPVTIAAPGSYRLTSDLRLVGAQEAIRVTADDVTLDLNGFAISCRTPTIPSFPCSNSPGSLNGLVLNGDNVRVENGTIRGMSASGIFAGFDVTFSLDRLRVVDNGANGLRAIASRGEITRSVFRDNAGDGLRFEAGGSPHAYSLDGVQSLGNAAAGLRAEGLGVGRVAHSRFENNGVVGMTFEGPCEALVSHTVTAGNGGTLSRLGLASVSQCRVAVDKLLLRDGGLGSAGVEVLGCSTSFTQGPPLTPGFWTTTCP